MKGVDAVEINVSCPNIKDGGLVFGTNAKSMAQVVKEVKKNTSKVVITKLSPNVTSITEMAKAAEDAGTDALSLINTLLGMKIDIHRQRPVLGNVTGGLSGPCIRPVAVRMCYEVAQAVKVPIIGMGGIMCAFVNPAIAETISLDILEYMDKHNIKKIQDMIGLALPGRC